MIYVRLDLFDGVIAALVRRLHRLLLAGFMFHGKLSVKTVCALLPISAWKLCWCEQVGGAAMHVLVQLLTALMKDPSRHETSTPS